MQTAKLAITVLGVLLFSIPICTANVNYDFVQQDGDIEQKLGPMVRKAVNIILGLGLGLCMIAVAIGACQWFGHFLSMDKDKGKDRIKRGAIGIVFFGVFWSFIAAVFNIAGMT